MVLISELISKYGELGSALCSFAAAVLWAMSARIRTPKTFAITVLTEHSDDAEFPGSQVIASGWGESKELTDLGLALRKQSLLSAEAAMAAAGAAILQVAVILVHRISN